MEPIYSILISPHNGSEYLEETIKSVLTQTFSNWELLIGGSIRSLSITDPRITRIVQDTNSRSSSLNDLVTYARGKWICLLEPGDRWESTKLARQHEARLGPAAEAEIIGCGDPIGYIPHEFILDQNPIMRSSAMIKKENAYWHHENDYDLWLNLDSFHIKMYNIENTLVTHHTNTPDTVHTSELVEFYRPYILAKNKRIVSRDLFIASRLPRSLPPNCTVHVDVHEFHGTGPYVFIQLEPEIIVQQEEYLIKNWHKYERIYTFNERVFNLCPNALKYVYGTKWLYRWEYEAMLPSKKKFAVSSVCGTKYTPGANGHLLRMVLYQNQKIFTHMPMTLYRSAQKPELPDFGSNPFLGERKTPLFETFQFAIIIENAKQKNYFSEKIMDCLLAKTIPIYYGCPNIGDFFDVRGFIIIEAVEIEPAIHEFHHKISTLDENYYSRHLEFIENNYKVAQQYIDVYVNLENAQKKEHINYY